MPKTVFPPNSDLIRFDTRMPKLKHVKLVEIGQRLNPYLSLNQIINMACDDFILKHYLNDKPSN